MGTRKGAEEDKIIKLLVEWRYSKDIKNEGIKKPTVFAALKRLKHKGLIIIRSYDGGTQYKLKSNDDADSAILNFIFEKLELENLKKQNPKVIKLVIEDLSELCKQKRISNPIHLKNIITLLASDYLSSEDISELLSALKAVIVKYVQNKELDMIKKAGEFGKAKCKHEKESDFQLFRNICLDKKRDIKQRERALNILELVQDNKIDNTILTLLKDPDNIFEKMLSVKSIIYNTLAKSSYMRNKLYNLTLNKNKIVAKRALDLLAETRELFVGIK